MGGRRGSKGFRWAKLTENESTARLVIFFFFIFSFLCSLTVSPFIMLFSLTTEPDPRLHRPFHIGTFLPSRVKQVVFLEKYSGWTCCIAFQNRTYIEIRAWLLKVAASNCHLSTLWCLAFERLVKITTNWFKIINLFSVIRLNDQLGYQNTKRSGTEIIHFPSTTWP